MGVTPEGPPWSSQPLPLSSGWVPVFSSVPAIYRVQGDRLTRVDGDPAGLPGTGEGARRRSPERRAAEGRSSAAPLPPRPSQRRPEGGTGARSTVERCGGRLPGSSGMDSRHQGLEERRQRRYQALAGPASPSRWPRSVGAAHSTTSIDATRPDGHRGHPGRR